MDFCLIVPRCFNWFILSMQNELIISDLDIRKSHERHYYEGHSSKGISNLISSQKICKEKNTRPSSEFLTPSKGWTLRIFFPIAEPFRSHCLVWSFCHLISTELTQQLFWFFVCLFPLWGYYWDHFHPSGSLLWWNLKVVNILIIP